MPRVWNKRDPNVPSDAVYVGRPTKWGNPYSHLTGTRATHRVATRNEAVDAYEDNLSEVLKAAARRELRGRDLVCWCYPARCHADVLLKIANDPAVEDSTDGS